MRIDFRLVQRMGRTTDQLPAGVARQSRVAVESDHVANRAELRQVADRCTKGIGRAGLQQPVQGRQLAPFSLFSHPCALLPIPLPRPMQEVEDPRAIGTIALVEPFDLRAGQLQQPLIAGQRFLIGIRKIAQQGEPQIVVLIGQVPQFELLHEIPHRPLGGQQRRYGHQRAMLGGNSRREIQTHHRPGRHQEGAQPVHQAHRKLSGRPGIERQQQQRGRRTGDPHHFQPHAYGRRGDHGE